MNQIIKLFMDGPSQALRLPAAYQFDTKEVSIRQDSHTGDVILSGRPDNWDSFIAALQRGTMPMDFVSAPTL